MTKLICIESCKAYGPFGVGEWIGNDEEAISGQYYYANNCSSGVHYYLASQNYGEGNSAHMHPSFMGLFESKFFVKLAECRDIQITEILS